MIGGFAGYIAGQQAGATGWKMAGYIGIGAVVGAATGGIVSGFSSVMAGGAFGAGFIGSAAACSVSSSFLSGAALGAIGGYTGGATLGFGYSILEGNNIGVALKSGYKGGLIGGASGAVFGGLYGGIDAAVDDRNFWDGGLTGKQKLQVLWGQAKVDGVIQPDDQAVGNVRIGKYNELKGNYGQANYGDRIVTDDFIEVDGIKYNKAVYKNNDILVSRKLIRQMWRGLAPIEALNHEVIHTTDMFNASYWDSPDVNTLVTNPPAYKAWMEVHAYKINVQNSDWSVFQINLQKNLNILKSYGIY